MSSDLDKFTTIYSTGRHWSPVKTEECPLPDPVYGGYMESDEHMRARLRQERRELDRTPCGEGGCNLDPRHAGSHRGSCGCLNGCKALECPNL